MDKYPGVGHPVFSNVYNVCTNFSVFGYRSLIKFVQLTLYLCTISWTDLILIKNS